MAVSSITTRNLANGATVITTSTTDSVYDAGITDISIIPYIRHQLITFSAYGLKPDRQVWVFFDDTDVTDYIIRPDELSLSSNASSIPFIVNPQASVFPANNGTIVVGAAAGAATVVQATRFYDFVNATASLQDDAGPRQRKRILRLVRSSGRFANAQSFVVSSTSNTGTIGAITVRGGETLENFFQTTSSNTIQLPLRTKDVANNYWGVDGSNTIILMPRHRKRHRAVRAYIGDGVRGFDNVTQTLYLSNTLPNIVASDEDDPVQVGEANTSVAWTIAGDLVTDYEGKISGTFSVPAGIFRTGERVFRIIDTPTNSVADCTTRADYKFDSSGLKTDRKQTVITKVTQKIIAPPPVHHEERESVDFGSGDEAKGGDPLAQTFFVSGSNYPNGMFLSAVDIFFRSKDQIVPVKVQIRPTVNGYPSARDIVPFGETTINAENITTSDDASVATKASFATPVYLLPGEYALVVLTNSLNYEVFVSELGGTIIGTTNKVSKQPYVGSLFKSQNASTWTAVQLEDLCFRLYKCIFTGSGSTSLNSSVDTIIDSTIQSDLMLTHIDETKLPNTAITYSHTYPGQTSQTYVLDNEIVPSSRVAFTPTGTSYVLTASLTTGDSDISPVLYHSSGKVVCVAHDIENAELANANFTIVNSNFGYTVANSDVPLTITGTLGSGATATARTDSTGNLVSINVTNGGSGYTSNVLVTILGGNSSAIAVSSELDSSGGPVAAKYISRTVTLASSFDAGDLRVWLTAYKPLGTDIAVYYKVRSFDDSTRFDDLTYVKMVGSTSTSSLSSSRDGYRNSAIEYEFRPVDTTVGVSYSSAGTTHTTFNQYAIKIVLLAQSTTITPVVYDMRAIALPSPQ